MTRDKTVAHWRRGARDSLESAALLHAAGKYALVLFHCQLAVEKGLKAAHVAEHDAAPPPTHDLLALAEGLGRSWTEEQKTLLDTLTDLAVLARYGDETWQEVQATADASARWVSQASSFLSLLLP